MAAAADTTVKVRVSAFDAVVFDLDGVVTRTAALHAAAWRELFDGFLSRRAEATGEPFRPFDVEQDYRRYVDGKPRQDGARSFLESRGIHLPEGSPGDTAEQQTVFGLGARKDALFQTLLARSGVEVFSGSVSFIRHARSAGLKTAVVSASRNTAQVLDAAGVGDLFDVRVDGVEAERLRLRGKPAPDTFAYAARTLRVAPARAIGVEDALAGVQAIRGAGYGLTVGVDRGGQRTALQEAGADVVVQDLSDLRLIPDRPADAPEAGGERGTQELPAAPTTDAQWLIEEDGFTITREHEIESLFAIGNGRLGSRASLAEGGAMSAPATFVGGAYDPKDDTPSLLVLPEWAHVEVHVEGAPLGLGTGRILSHRRVLDLRQGILWRDWRHEDPAGRITRVYELRFASLAERGLLIQSVTVSPENYSGTIAVAAPAIDLALSARGDLIVALSSAAAIAGPEHAAPASAPGKSFELDAQIGDVYRLDRVAAVVTSRDHSEPGMEARRSSVGGLALGVGALIAAHREAWGARWAASDLVLEGDSSAQRALRFAIYHLTSAVDPDNDRVSIGARALTGVGYNGHVFWDTDIYMLPFFALTWPEAARALLEYRHNTLPAARSKAARHGQRGAFYAWESADTGEDVTPSWVLAPDGEVVPIVLADQEQHIGADVAYAVWNYWRATGDDGFLLKGGAEIIFETARFWASRAERGEDDLLHIRGVVGPDEYHLGVDDDAYTNGMARWNLQAGVEVADVLRIRWPDRWRGLSDVLRLEWAEVLDWSASARRVYTGLDEKTGLIEQFRGYFDLEEIDLAALEPRNAPVDVILGRERIAGSKVIKQPDVVMLLHLLWDRFPPQVRLANFRYYEPRCAHGSSLSPAIHAAVAARLGETALAERYFRKASDIDLADNMGNAAAGVHAAALGGLWQAAVFGFAGLRLGDAGPTADPRLPESWRSLSLRFQWRGRDQKLMLAGDAAHPGPIREEG